MDATKIYYSGFDDLITFDQWSKNAVQKEYLSLFDDYAEPTYNDRKDNKQEKLLMFVSKTKAVINRPAASIDLKKMVSLDYAASLDPEIKHRAISAAQLMPNVADKSKSGKFQLVQYSRNGFHFTPLARNRSYGLESAEPPVVRSRGPFDLYGELLPLQRFVEHEREGLQQNLRQKS